MSKKVSVIVPVYNKAEYIERCLDSVFNQSFNDFELIVIDDHSSDGSYEYLTNRKESKEFLLVRQETNKGVSAARNLGLDLARCEYICFLDADDYWHPDFLSIMYMKAEEKGIEFLGSNYYYIKDSKKVPAFNTSEINLILDYFLSAIRREIPFTSSSVMIKQSIIGDLRFIDSLNHGEDQVFWAALVSRAKVSAVIPDTLAYYDTDVEGSLCKLYEPTKFPSYLGYIRDYKTRNVTYILYCLKLFSRCVYYTIISSSCKGKKMDLLLTSSSLFIKSIILGQRKQ